MVNFFPAQILAFLLLIVSSDLDILSAIFKNIYLNNSFLSTAVVNKHAIEIFDDPLPKCTVK